MSQASDTPAALRRDLLDAAAKIGSNEVWLNRDAHVTFQCERDRTGTQVFRVAEDDQAAAAEGTGPVIVTGYLMLHSAPGILVNVSGGQVPAPAEPERKSWLQRWREARKTYRAMRAGFLDADPAEIRHLITQINGAERIGPADTEEN